MLSGEYIIKRRRESKMPGKHKKKNGKKKMNGLTAKQKTLPKNLQKMILKSKARKKKK